MDAGLHVQSLTKVRLIYFKILIAFQILIFFLDYSNWEEIHVAHFSSSWNLITLEKRFQGQNEGSQGQSPPSCTITGGEREGLGQLTPLLAPVWSSLRENQGSGAL